MPRHLAMFSDPLPREPVARFVLCYLDHNRATPWVTWLERRDVSDEAQSFPFEERTYWGRYFADFEDALRDLETRSTQAGGPIIRFAPEPFALRLAAKLAACGTGVVDRLSGPLFSVVMGQHRAALRQASISGEGWLDKEPGEAALSYHSEEDKGTPMPIRHCYCAGCGERINRDAAYWRHVDNRVRHVICYGSPVPLAEIVA